MRIAKWCVVVCALVGLSVSAASAADLALDESAADIAASLDALEQGDYETSGDYYGRVAERWAHAQSLTYVN